MSILARYALLAACLVNLAAVEQASAQNAGPLPAYNVDPSQVSVSGVSSGASMAIQLGVAYASRIMGVAAFSTAPYDCLRGLGSSLTSNNCTGFNTPQIAELKGNMLRWSGKENDPVQDIASQRIYVFVGKHDVTDSATVVNQTVNLYREFVPDANLQYETAIDAGHTLPTDFEIPGWPGYTCEKPGEIPLANCRYDGAGVSLQWIYGPLTRAVVAAGSLFPIDQSEFVTRAQGMDTIGWLYVPKSCEAGAVCRLHVFLHPCGQSYFTRNDTLYANYSGHSLWADANNIVLLFPQTYPDTTVNPDGCWDDSGIYDDGFDRKAGKQTSAIMAMVDRITSGFRAAVKAIEYRHADWDHYFVTSSPDEIAKLDAGVFGGWARTGETFDVYPVGTPGTSNVCRFFSTSFAPKSSHFYTASAEECDSVKRNPDWQFEDVVFAVAVPDSIGGCRALTSPVHRLYNNGQGGAPNHRYTTSLSTRAAMVASGWTSEGAGDEGVVACSAP